MDISKKKKFYRITDGLREYLGKYLREQRLPVTYDDLTHWQDSFPLTDEKGEDTLWCTVLYDQNSLSELNFALTKIYAMLRTDGDVSVMDHLQVDRIDYCSFGNSNPFRVRIVNLFNDNYDYFYVKVPDASRVYGLELEHILSPNRINYLVNDNTLIEEHIPGIPGDKFITDYYDTPNFNKVRIAKEFVKFNERCFVRLLGDMRSYNYVVAVTPDFDNEQYRIRAVDFDQQSYEGAKTMYQPQFFKENRPLVQMCMETMTPETVQQYQYEERALMKRRYASSSNRIAHLLDTLCEDCIAPIDKVERLQRELNDYHNTDDFLDTNNMGKLVRTHIYKMLVKHKPELRGGL